MGEIDHAFCGIKCNGSNFLLKLVELVKLFMQMRQIGQPFTGNRQDWSTFPLKHVGSGHISTEIGETGQNFY